VIKASPGTDLYGFDLHVFCVCCSAEIVEKSKATSRGGARAGYDGRTDHALKMIGATVLN